MPSRTPSFASRSVLCRDERFQALPPLWQQSLIEHAHAEAERLAGRQRLKTLALYTAAAVMAGVAARPPALQAAVYSGTITGVAENDRPGGTGSYDLGYVMFVDEDGTLRYSFAGGDSIELQATGPDVYALRTDQDAAPVTLDVADGLLTLSAIREETGSWGLAVALATDGNRVTINGDTRLVARADDEVQPEGVGSGAHGVIVRGGGNVVFNGATDIHARSPGYARAVWVADGGTLTFNGPTTILGESRGTLDAVYNSGGGRIFFNGDTTVSAHSIWPSDNAHGIYNDNINSRLRVDGNLTLDSIAQGSTAFGVRNQGIMEVTGNATVIVGSPRSAHGIANTHRLARMIWGGDVDLHVRGGSYVPFGNPSGLSNDRSPGAYMRFDGAVNVDVASAAVTYGAVNTGSIEFTSPTAPVTFTVATSCDGCDVYGIRNFGVVSVAGGLSVDTSANGGGTHAIWTLAGTQDAVVSVNRAGGQSVQLSGDVVTARDAANSFRSAAEITLDTADSWLRGNVAGWADHATGEAILDFTNGASWMPRGTGTLVNDFGSGVLRLGNGGGIDLSDHWGRYAPGTVPTHSHRILSIDSTDTGSGASVVLEDGARFLLLSDITGRNGNASADRIVFGSGIGSFSASGTQGVGIVYDPVLDDTSWVNDDTLRDGTTIDADLPLVIVDTSAAAGGRASFAAVQGLDGEWSQTFENALVHFTYTPQVALSADGSQILLNGIAIRGDGSGAPDPGNPGPGNPGDDNLPDEGEGPAIRPSETVLSAADAADSLLTLWDLGSQTPAQRIHHRLRNGEEQPTGLWLQADGSRQTADTAYARGYTQRADSLTVGFDRATPMGKVVNLTGVALGRDRANADYQNGEGELSATRIGLYTGWISDGGGHLFLGAETASLDADYTARDSQGRAIAGEYRTRANRLYAEGGYRFSSGGGYFLEPQLGLHLGRVQSGRHAAANGVEVRQEGHDASFVRAGVAVGKTLQGSERSGSVYARAAARQHLGDDIELTASRDGGSIRPDSADRSGWGREFAVGGDVTTGRTGVYFEASRASGSHAERDWTARVGVRMSW